MFRLWSISRIGTAQRSAMARRAAPFRLERIPSGNCRNRIASSIAEDADLVGTAARTGEARVCMPSSQAEEAM